MKIYIFIFLLCFGITLQSFAENKESKSEIRGHIIDKVTGEDIPFASIQLKGTELRTSSDDSGNFLLSNISPGKYTVIASMLGYLSGEHTIDLTKEKSPNITVSLSEDLVELATVVVSANRNETSRKETSSIVNVLTPLVFETTNSQMLSDGLCYMPGLRVENNCQNCGFQQVRINGLDGQYSQLLIDSRPIISALSGVYGIEQIPAGMIERVEVMRGGGSALYGSNAIGGIINIITKEPVKNTGMASYNLTMIGGESAENNINLNASLISKDYKTGAYIFSNIKSRTAYDSDNDGFTEIPELKGNTSGIRAFYKPSNLSKITMEYHNIMEKRRGGNNLDLPPHEADIAEMTEHNINGGGLKYDIYSPNHKHKVSIYGSTQYTDRQSYYGAGQDPNAYGTTTDLTYDIGGSYSYNFDKLWFMPANIIGGLEYNSDELKDNTYSRDMNQRTYIYSAFLQNEWKNEKFSILLGARLDKHNQINDPIFSPRLNFRYNPTESIGLRASYSEGFRAPQAFSEDLHILAAAGNVVLIELSPDLKPEHSKSVSASADLYHTFGTIQTNLLIEGFYTDLSDVFFLKEKGTDAEGNLIQEKQNASGAIVKGINLEAKAALSKNYQLQAGLTLQKSTYKEAENWSTNPNVPSTKKMFRTPDLYGYFTATATFWNDFTIALSGTYSGPMYVQHLAGYISEDRIEKTTSFFNSNIKLLYDIDLEGGLCIQLHAGLDNIFDAYQKDFDKGPDRDSGYIYGPLYPRSYFAGLKVVF